MALSALLAGSLGLPASVVAQKQKPDTLPPIEVVATRRPEAPHDVPASIEVISGDQLRARGATSLRDALSLAAGVAIAPGGDGGPAGAVPEFWGLREFDAFLLVVDGIPWGGALNPDIATLNLRDIERIEILRGPAPVTYGATSFVGVINVVHKASSATSRTVSVHGANFGTGGLAADFSIPTGSWTSRASADVDRQGFKDDRTSFTRGHALWRSTLISGERKSWVTGDLTMLAQDPASPHPRDGATLSTAVPVDANHNPNDAYLNNTRFMVSGGLDRPVGQGSLWGTTASFSHSSQRIFRGFLTDLSNTPDNASGFKENIDINDAYVDTHVLWAEHARLRFMTGVDVLFSSGEAKGATFTYTVPLDGSTATSVPEPSTLDKDAGDTRLFLGAYGSAEWRPSSRVTVNGGLRLNMTSERHGEGETVNHTRPSGDFGVLFGLWEKNADHLRLFASYKNTFKPAAFDFSLAENEDVLDPETSQSIEGGLKFRGLKGRFDLEASAFRMDLENMVIATEVNGVPALENAGKTRFRGVELAADYRLPHAILARATYSYHDSRFVDFVQEFDGVPTQLAGNRIEMVPRQLMSAGLSYSPEKGFIANANVNYTGDRYLNKRNTALAEAYLTVDAGIGYRTGRLEVRMDGRNLSDRRDPVSESEFGDAQYYLMPARTVRISAVLTY